MVEHVFAPFQKSEQISASAFKYLANLTGKEGDRAEAKKTFTAGITTLFNPKKTFVPNDDYFSWAEAFGEIKKTVNESGIPEKIGENLKYDPVSYTLRSATGTQGKEFDKAMGKLMVSNVLDTLAVLDTVFMNPDNLIGTRVLRFGDRLDAIKLKDGTALNPRGEKELARLIKKFQGVNPEMGFDHLRELAEKQLLSSVASGGKFQDAGGIIFMGAQFSPRKFTQAAVDKLWDAPKIGKPLEAGKNFVKHAFSKYAGLDHGTESYFREVETAAHGFVQLGEREIEKLTRGIAPEDLKQMTRLLDSGEWHKADGIKSVNKFGDTAQDVLGEFDKFFRDIYALEKKHGVEIESLKNYVPLIIEDPKKANEFLEVISRLPSQSDPFSAHRQLLSVAEAERLGLKPNLNLAQLAQIRLKAASKAVAHRKLLQGLSEQHAYLGEPVITPKSFRFYSKSSPLPDTPKGLAEAHKKVLEFPPDVQEAIKVFDRLDWKTELLRSPDSWKNTVGQALNVVDGIHNFFKNNVTLLFPQFHTRNSLSNVMLNMYDVGGEVFRMENHRLVGDILDTMRGRKGKSVFRTTNAKGILESVDQTEKTEARKLLKGMPRTERAGVAHGGDLQKALSDEEAKILADFKEIEFYPDALTLQRVVSRTGVWEQAYRGPAGSQKTAAAAKQAKRSLKDTLKPSKTPPPAVLKDRFEREYTLDQLTDLAEKHGVLTDWKKLTDNTGVDENLVYDLFGKYADGLFEKGRRVGTRIENEGRLLNFVANIRRGHTPQEAALRTKKFLFDYGNLAPVEREFFARVIPFYSFGRYNTALTADLLARAPGRLAAPLRFAMGMTETLTGTNPQERPEWAPSYLGDRGFYLNPQMKQKEMHRFIVSTGAPMEDVNRFADIFRDPMGSTFPTIKWMTRLASGQFKMETFRKDPITGEAGEFSNKAPESFAILANLPDNVKKFIGFDEQLVTAPGGQKFREVYLNPYLLEMMRNLGFSRGPVMADKVFDPTLPWFDRIASVLSPVSFKMIDPEVEGPKKAFLKGNTQKKAGEALKKSMGGEGRSKKQRSDLKDAKEEAVKTGTSLKEFLKNGSR